MIIDIAGTIVGEVRCVQPHPKGKFIWLADVDIGKTAPTRIVFGGDHQLIGGELVPVAPPGSRINELRLRGMKQRLRTMRARRFREEWSHGMLCSLGELGWVHCGPNEVAILRDVTPGQHLDDLPAHRRPQIAVGWDQAKAMEREALTRAAVLYDLSTLPRTATWRHPW